MGGLPGRVWRAGALLWLAVSRGTAGEDGRRDAVVFRVRGIGFRNPAKIGADVGD